MAEDDDVDSTCAECGGACCSFRSIRISYLSLDACQRYDSMLLENDGLGELLLADGTVPDMDWYTIRYEGYKRALAFECNHLTDDGKCGVYDKRPSMCRSFSCEAIDPEYDVDLDEMLEMFGWEGSGESPDDVVDREVTDRVREIIARDATLPDSMQDVGGA